MFSAFKQDTQKNSIAVLDGVRAVACLAVISFHLNLIAHLDLKLWTFSVGSLASALMLGGGAGVTLFFVLSGFLLFMPYAKSLLFSKDWPSMRQFYLRRALRILPGYYVALFIMILLFEPDYLQPDHFKQLVLFLTLFMDSTPATYQHLNGPFWTLAVEWQFYLLLPWLALAFSWVVRHGKLKQRVIMLTACLFIMMAWGVGTRYVGLYFTNNPTQSVLVSRPVLNWVLFFTYGTNGKFLEDFAVGMLIAALYIYSRQAAKDHLLSQYLRRASWWIWGSGILLLFFTALWHFNNWFHTGLRFLNPISQAFTQWGELCFSFGFGLCVIALLFGEYRLKRPFEWLPLRWIGYISYSLYMWHLYVLEDFKEYLRPLHAAGWRGGILYIFLWLCALFIVIPFSYGMYKWVELPWIELSNRWRKRPRAVVSAVVNVKDEVPVGAD